MFPPPPPSPRRPGGETLCIGFAGQWVVASSHSNRCHRRSIYRVRQSRESDLPPRLRLPSATATYAPRRVRATIAAAATHPPPPPSSYPRRPSFVFRFIPIGIYAAERTIKTVTNHRLPIPSRANNLGNDVFNPFSSPYLCKFLKTLSIDTVHDR